MPDLSPEVRQSLASAFELALQRHRAGDLVAAEALYGQIVLADPRNALALHNLGLIRQQRGEQQAALELYTAAVRIQPHEARFHVSLGAARYELKDLAGATEAFREATVLEAGNVVAFENLAIALHKLELLEDAAGAYRRALELNPDSKVRTDYGYLLRETDRLEEAESLYREALDRNPLNPPMGIQLGVLQLSQGDLSGWRTYEWSHWSIDWLKLDRPLLLPLPKWSGEDLSGRTILLYGEQGIGDEIMFASAVQEVAQKAARTVLLCEPRLVPLFARSFPGTVVAAKPGIGRAPPIAGEFACDFRLSLSRLPAILRQREEQFTGKPFLLADPARVGEWRQRLAGLGGRINVGISWRGGLNDRTQASRSLELAMLAPLFDVSDVRFVNLQYGRHGEEIGAFNANSAQPLINFGDIDPLKDMDGLAALIGALDLVISVDNSTVHLAGALGVPVWMLTPFNPDFRWPRKGETSLWYKSLRLFRQAAPRRSSWPETIAQTARALRTWQPAGRPSADTAARAPATIIRELPKPTALLLNDTTYWYDWNCTASSLALHEALRTAGHVVEPLHIFAINGLQPVPATVEQLDDERIFAAFRERNPGIIALLEQVSDVILNGEGDLRGMDKTARTLLWIAWIAKTRFGKRTCIVNHSAAPWTAGEAANAFHARIYRAMDHVAVRESRSAAYLAGQGITATLAFDCLPLFLDRHPPVPAGGKRVVLAGSAIPDLRYLDMLVTLAEHATKRGFRVQVLAGANALISEIDVRMMGKLHPRLRGRYELIAATSDREWFGTIAGASLLVCGRFHHAVAAAWLGTPFLAAPGVDHDIDSLLSDLGLSSQHLLVDPANIPQARRRLEALLEDPRPALASTETLQRLRELAQRNFLS